jgi:hypothetical protein
MGLVIRLQRRLVVICVFCTGVTPGVANGQAPGPTLAWGHHTFDQITGIATTPYNEVAYAYGHTIEKLNALRQGGFSHTRASNGITAPTSLATNVFNDLAYASAPFRLEVGEFSDYRVQRHRVNSIGGKDLKIEDIALDAQGNFYMAGWTFDPIFAPSAGHTDMVLIKYDSGVNQVWAKQFGTNRQDEIKGVEVDAAGNVYVAGTAGATAFNPADTSGERAMFAAKYDPDGNLLWSSQVNHVASQGHSAYDIAVDQGGNVYVAGLNSKGPTANEADASVHKFSPTGTKLWTTNVGTPTADAARNLAVDTWGNVYVAGETFGGFAGPNADTGNPAGIFLDGFLMQLNTSGQVRWKHQFGLSGQETVAGVALAGNNRLYVAGSTQSGLGGGGAFDGTDGYLLAYDVPEPSSMGLMLTALATSLLSRRRHPQI